MEWTSVKDRLPKEAGLTYIVANNSSVDVDIFDGEVFIKYTSQVSHWMPLPKPPK